MNALALRRTRLSPWSEIENLQERLDRIFGGSFPRFTPEETMEWMPVVDMKETEDEFVLTAELPGVAQSDVNVELEQNVLTIKGEKKSEREEKKEKDGHWHLIERSYGSFARSFTLPPAVDGGKVKADFSAGVLTVHLPKRKESTAKRITIGGK